LGPTKKIPSCGTGRVRYGKEVRLINKRSRSGCSLSKDMSTKSKNQRKGGHLCSWDYPCRMGKKSTSVERSRLGLLQELNATNPPWHFTFSEQGKGTHYQVRIVVLGKGGKKAKHGRNEKNPHPRKPDGSSEKVKTVKPQRPFSVWARGTLMLTKEGGFQG